MSVKENLTRVRSFISTSECFCSVLGGEECHRCEVLALLPEKWPHAIGVCVDQVEGTFCGLQADSGGVRGGTWAVQDPAIVRAALADLRAAVRPENIIGTSGPSDLTQQ